MLVFRCGWERQQTTTYSNIWQTYCQGLFSIHSFFVRDLLSFEADTCTKCQNISVENTFFGTNDFNIPPVAWLAILPPTLLVLRLAGLPPLRPHVICAFLLDTIQRWRATKTPAITVGSSKIMQGFNDNMLFQEQNGTTPQITPSSQSHPRMKEEEVKFVVLPRTKMLVLPFHPQGTKELLSNLAGSLLPHRWNYFINN